MKCSICFFFSVSVAEEGKCTDIHHQYRYALFIPNKIKAYNSIYKR